MVVIHDTEMEQMGLQKGNAQRVMRERTAQARRAPLPAKNYRVDSPSTASGDDTSGSKTFHSPLKGIGSGPVGPFFVLFAFMVRRFRKKR